jgi:hypothetical protein
MKMSDKSNLPAIRQQITELVLAGSIDYAEDAFNEAAEQLGDIAVVEVLDSMESHVASLHLSAFDGGKLSLATLLISPKAWAASLVFFAARWNDDMIEDKPEALAESLFAHIHGIVFAGDDTQRRSALLHEALATDWGTTAFAVLFSTATEEIIEIANDIHTRGAHSIGQTTSDHDVIPLALEIARTDEDAWDRVLFEIFPDWQPGENLLSTKTDEDEDEDDHKYAPGRSTKELLVRLRKQVPGKYPDTVKAGQHTSLGEDIFS